MREERLAQKCRSYRTTHCRLCGGTGKAMDCSVTCAPEVIAVCERHTEPTRRITLASVQAFCEVLSVTREAAFGGDGQHGVIKAALGSFADA